MAVDRQTVDRLRHARAWRPIPNCPGRFVLTGADRDLTPAALAGPGVVLHEFRVPAARDLVIVARFEDGGLICYRRDNGTTVHTLNTVEGFARKLDQLGITDDGLGRAVGVNPPSVLRIVDRPA